jgi:hypothetical protein
MGLDSGHPYGGLPGQGDEVPNLQAVLARAALPAGEGDPFSGVQFDDSAFYWSSTTDAYYTAYAWDVTMSNGFAGHGSKTEGAHVWPVRGGQCRASCTNG